MRRSKAIGRSELVQNLPFHILGVQLQHAAQLPIIKIKIKGCTYFGMLDSGACVSLLNQAAFNEIKDLTKIHNLSRNIKLHTITQEEIPFSKCVSFSFNIENKSVAHPFFVTRDRLANSCSFLLGFDFLKSNQAILDLKSNVLVFGNITVPLLDPNIAEFTESGVSNTLCAAITAKQQENLVCSPSGPTNSDNDNGSTSKNKYNLPSKSTIPTSRGLPPSHGRSSKHSGRSKNQCNRVSHRNKKNQRQSKNEEVPRLNRHESNKSDSEVNKLFLRPHLHLKIPPLTSLIVELNTPRRLKPGTEIMINPIQNKQSFIMEHSINTILASNRVRTIISNPHDSPMFIRKSTRVAEFTTMFESRTDSFPPRRRCNGGPTSD